jgi:hypothetical protein
MNTVHQRWRMSAFGLLLLALLSACAETGGGYVVGAYGPSAYDYGGWGPGYHVAPPRGGERRPERSSPRAYRPAPRSRPAPSIPTRPHGR